MQGPHTLKLGRIMITGYLDFNSAIHGAWSVIRTRHSVFNQPTKVRVYRLPNSPSWAVQILRGK